MLRSSLSGYWCSVQEWEVFWLSVLLVPGRIKSITLRGLGTTSPSYTPLFKTSLNNILSWLTGVEEWV